mgnify:FL=1
MTTFTDEMLGLITVRTNARARRIIMRPQVDGVQVTVPPRTTERLLTDTLNHFRQRLRARQLEMQKGAEEKGMDSSRIDLNFRLETDLISIALERGTRKDFYLRTEQGRTVIVCPPDTDFNEPTRQEWLHRVVERALRLQAERVLPERLRALSVLHNLPFNTCKVNVSKGRWGSCSGRKDISLSCYLALLPPHLREYVMLHELCHTREMNHGPRFWALLDNLTDGKAKALRKELKGHQTCF